MKYHQLEGQQFWIRRPQSILEAAMASEARQNKDGVIRLIYSDGTSEYADSKETDLHDFPNWAELVVYVQKARKEWEDAR